LPPPRPFFSPPVLAFAEDPPTSEELEKKVEVLTEEVRHAREQANLPETDQELKSWYGMGPAASKVYSKTSGLSIGGYAEFFVQAPTGTDGSQRSGDMLRMVPYLGYKFSDKILMNTEIEFEHGSTEENLRGEEGAVSIEFCYLDFLLSESVNVRAGNLLMPVGFLNEMHEPPFYWGECASNDRAASSFPRRGMSWEWGLHGAIAPTVSYNAYLVNGLNAQGFEETGIREGRQAGTEPFVRRCGRSFRAAHRPRSGADGRWFVLRRAVGSESNLRGRRDSRHHRIDRRTCGGAYRRIQGASALCAHLHQ
jgi:hypothetical protein